MTQEIRRMVDTVTPRLGSSDLFSAMRAEMDRVFDTFLDGNIGGHSVLSRVAWRGPRIDLHEADKEFLIEAELPGMDEKDVSVTLNNGVLTLKGDKKSEREEEKENYHLMERSYGAFRRSFQLGDAVDPDKVSATFDKGVLTVRLAKRAEAARAERRIPIGKG